MNMLDEILDAEAGTENLSFRTANGICRINSERIELIRNLNETASMLVSSGFIIRIVLFFVISALFIYHQFIIGPLNIQFAWIYGIPASIILLSIMGNLNTVLYRIRSLLFVGLLFWFIYLEYERSNTTTAMIYLAFSVMLTMSFFGSFNYAYDTILMRKDIINVRFINSIPALTRAYFLVSFKHENGKERKRPILLPGILNKGESEKKHALEVMKIAGLI